MTSFMAVRQDGGHVALATWSGGGTWTLVTNPVPRTEDYTFIDLATRSSEQAVHTAVGYLPDDRVVVEATDPGSGRSSYQVVAPDGTKTDFGGFNRVVATLVGHRPGRRADAVPRRRLVLRGPGPVVRGPGAGLGDVRPLARGVQPRRAVRRRAGAYSDGLGSPTVGILDAATGEPLVDFVSGNDPESAATVGDVAWEDATTLLATVNQGTEEFLVRLTADGRVERGRHARPGRGERPVLVRGRPRAERAQPSCTVASTLCDDLVALGTALPVAELELHREPVVADDRAEPLGVQAGLEGAGQVVELLAVELDVVAPS